MTNFQRSALYLQGNKFKLLNDILPHLEGYDVLVEPFCGSGVVSLNGLSRVMFERCYCNDISPQLIGLHKSILEPSFLLECYQVNQEYDSTKEDYLRLREDYNKDKSRLDMLYNLMMRSNNNMIRFNSSGGYNMPFGERNRFNLDKLIFNQKHLQKAEFFNQSFGVFLNNLDQSLSKNYYKPRDAVVYVDCPYHISKAIYQESNGWTTQEDTVLLDNCIKLTGRGYKVVYSNVFTNRGKTNHLLLDWCEVNKDLFEVHHLNIDYNNSNANKGSGTTDEVLIVSK